MYRREPLENTIINTLNSKAEEIKPRGGMGERVKSAVLSGTQQSRSIPRRPMRLYGYVAAVLLLFVSINTVYAGNISQAIKGLFGKTPVYSTTVEGKAYYLKNPVTLNKNLTLDSFMASEGRMEMGFETNLGIQFFKHMKVVPKGNTDTPYFVGGFAEDRKNHYLFSLTNETNHIKPIKAFDLLVDGKTYTVTLDEAESPGSNGIFTASKSNTINLVSVGANSTDKNGKRMVQLIASFTNKNIKLTALGEPVDKKVIARYEQREGGLINSKTEDNTKAIYATDKSGSKYKLIAPSDAKVQPVTIFETGAATDSPITIKLPALLATYEKSVSVTKVNIPKNGEKNLNQVVDLIAQKTVIKSIKRTSPTSAVLTFQLNTGANKNIAIRSFDMSSGNIKKYSAEFDDDKAVVTLELNKGVDALDLYISWPEFVMNGNWTIDLK